MEGLSQIPQGGAPQEGRDDAKQQEQEAQMRRELMATVLDTGARERLSRIALVSPERSSQIEGIIARMAQGGQLRSKVTENQLIDLLEQMEGAQGKKTAQKSTIVYHRRKDIDDDFDFDI